MWYVYSIIISNNLIARILLKFYTEFNSVRYLRPRSNQNMMSLRFENLDELAIPENLLVFLVNPSHCQQAEAINILSCALKCAHEGGILIKSALDKRHTSASSVAATKMSAADLVTETDVAVETVIHSSISATFPHHLFIGEEGTGKSIKDIDRLGKFVWVVDPIDGTTNFVHAFPAVAVSIAVCFENEPILGVVYNPMTNELWFAWNGCGAFMKLSDGNIIQLRTSGCSELGSALVSTGFAVPLLRRITPNKGAQEQLRCIVEHNTRVLMDRSRDIRRIGSAACDICFVAMGRSDAYFEFGIREWDIAAAIVILHEAGGDSSTVGGEKPYSLQGRNVLVAASQALREEMCSTLKDHDVVRIIEEIEGLL